MTDTMMTRPTTSESAEAMERFQKGGDVRAEYVEISQGGANSIDAGSVSIRQGGAGRVVAEHVEVTQGGIAVARTDRLDLGEGGSAFAVLAERATIGEGGKVFLLLARNASGDVRPLLDWRAAAAIAGGLVAIVALLRRTR